MPIGRAKAAALWLALLAILAGPPAAAAASDPYTSDVRACAAARELVPRLWQADAYAVPADIPPLMLAAIEGDRARVRAKLAAMPPADAARWRQLAMYTAAAAGQAQTVNALLQDGARANASATLPAFRPAFRAGGVAALEHQPPFTPNIVQGLEAQGLIGGRAPEPTGPAIHAAIMCHDAATVDVLLNHQADPMLQPWPTNPAAQRGADPFLTAIVTGDARITSALLNHGADPCIEDRRLRDARPAGNGARRTVAGIGRERGLPQALVQRLVCHATMTEN